MPAAGQQLERWRNSSVRRAPASRVLRLLREPRAARLLRGVVGYLWRTSYVAASLPGVGAPTFGPGDSIGPHPTAA